MVNLAATHHQAVVHNHHIAADFHTVEAHTSEARHNPAAFAEVVAKEILHQGVVFICVRHRVVQLEKHLCLAHALCMFLWGNLAGVNI